jgi:hypothetical protein
LREELLLLVRLESLPWQVRLLVGARMAPGVLEGEEELGGNRALGVVLKLRKGQREESIAAAEDELESRFYDAILEKVDPKLFKKMKSEFRNVESFQETYPWVYLKF